MTIIPYDSVLLESSSSGVYAPGYALAKIRSLVKAGEFTTSHPLWEKELSPENEEYWEEWSSILDNASFRKDDRDWIIVHDQDVWMIPVREEMTLKQLHTELGLNDFKGDPWGTYMTAAFDACNELNHRDQEGVDVPAELRYRPARVVGDAREHDSYFFDVFRRLTTECLTKIALHLYRGAKLEKEKGNSY